MEFSLFGNLLNFQLLFQPSNLLQQSQAKELQLRQLQVSVREILSQLDEHVLEEVQNESVLSLVVLERFVKVLEELFLLLRVQLLPVFVLELVQRL